MRQVTFREYGAPDVLRLENVPTPEPGPGQVLIRVEAAGLNFSDTMRRRNEYPLPTPLPYLPGGEVAGTVERVGTGVTSPAPGTRVVARLPNGGGYAEFALAPAQMVFALPPGVSAAQAVALQVQGLTAYLLLKQAARLQAGQSVLVHAAAGGVGTLLVQLAKSLGGGPVLATASSESKRTLARSLGAEAAIDYTQPDWPAQVKQANGGEGVSLILDAVGGEVFRRSFECLAPFGHLISFGNPQEQPCLVDAWRLTVPNQTVSGFYVGAYFARPEVIAEAFAFLFSQVASGQLQVQVGETLPLAQAPEAHRLLEGRQTTGKVVLVP